MSDDQRQGLRAALLVDEICDRFEVDLKRGVKPSIEDLLAGQPETSRSDLLRELLRIELEYVQRSDGEIDAAKYLKRFDGEGDDIVAQVLREFSAPPAESDSAGAISELSLYKATPASAGDRPTKSEQSKATAANGDVADSFSLRYEILEKIDEGAMGTVFLAKHLLLDKRVAVKVLKPDASSHRFLREARLLARVKSPHVVMVHDFEQLEDGRELIAMEWIDGLDLRGLMKQKGGALAESEATQLMRETCLGMQAAAEQGIIHRDVKPSNILIDPTGRALVADFGLARGPVAMDHTQTMETMGTPLYMAPEQAEDPRVADTRSDIYSFGATFYHVLTGQPPYSGETPFSVLYKHKIEPLTSPRAINASISEGMNAILERCLAKMPQDRFQSFAELLEQLNQSQDVDTAWLTSNDEQLEVYWRRYSKRRHIYLGHSSHFPQPDIYKFPSGRTLEIRCDDITQLATDAIVSSDNSWLTMQIGVSAAIRSAGGNGVNPNHFSPIRPGRSVVTSAGKLKAKFVFHCATIGQSTAGWTLPSRDLLFELMASCFYHADTLNVRRIAFPLLATGGAGFSREVCLDTEFRALARLFLRGMTSIEHASIVIFPLSWT